MEHIYHEGVVWVTRVTRWWSLYVPPQCLDTILFNEGLYYFIVVMKGEAFLLAVTKTLNGMERNGTERSVIFRLLTKKVRFSVKDT